MTYVILALAIVAGIAVWLVLRLRPDSGYGMSGDTGETPALVIPVRASAHMSAEPLPPVPAAPVTPPQQAPQRSAAARAQEHSTAPFRPPPGYQPPAYQPPAFVPAHQALEHHAPDHHAPAAAENGVSMSATDKVVHAIPVTDGTLQFLPGRLEIVDGDKRGRDIRFVRTWGEVPEITFGRVTGPPYRHVQLKSQTVSRQHARMQYLEGRWQLTNLSQTNPVIVNGEMLDPTRGQCVLHEGDQIEMGEVIFRFRER